MAVSSYYKGIMFQLPCAIKVKFCLTVTRIMEPNHKKLTCFFGYEAIISSDMKYNPQMLSFFFISNSW